MTARHKMEVTANETTVDPLLSRFELVQRHTHVCNRARQAIGALAIAGRARCIPFVIRAGWSIRERTEVIVKGMVLLQHDDDVVDPFSNWRRLWQSWRREAEQHLSP